MSSVVVEFCGLPGSGKTTVAKHAQEAIRARGARCDIADLGISARSSLPARVARRTAAAMRVSVRHPIETVESVRVLAATGQPRRRDTVAGAAQWLAVRALISHSHTFPGIHLLEEGIVQTMWTLALRAAQDPSPRLWQTLSPTSRADLVLMVDAPVELTLSRLNGRTSEHSRTQQLPAELRRVELEHGRKLLDRLLVDVTAPVLRIGVDDLASPAQLGERVAEMVLVPHA